jgi:hypothetical protein
VVNMWDLEVGLPRCTPVAETTLHVPATFVRGVLLQKLLAWVVLSLATFHAVQAQTVKSKSRLPNSNVDGVLEVVLAGAGIASRGFGHELEVLKLVNDLSKWIFCDSLINGPAFESHQRVLVVERSPNDLIMIRHVSEAVTGIPYSLRQAQVARWSFSRGKYNSLSRIDWMWARAVVRGPKSVSNDLLIAMP